MTVLDLLNQPWAITPEKLEAMCSAYERHAVGQKLNHEEIKAAIGIKIANSNEDPPPYTVQDGVAVIPVEGILAKKMNMFLQFSGGMSTQMLVQAVNDADADPLVHSIIVAMDTPGGEVDGTQQIGNAVASTTKPIVAWVDGMAASAGLWIATQCDAIYAASDTSQIGSMGVILKHTDLSKANDASGKKVTYIQSGKFKSVGNSDTPLSDDDKGHQQSRIDYLATLFTTAVADGRGIKPAEAWAKYGDARMFFAQEALSLGLIDGLSSMDAIIARLNIDFVSQQQNPGARATGKPVRPGASMFRTFATEADFTAVQTAEFERGKAAGATPTAELDRIKAEATTAGATAERERIKAVEAQSLGGHTKLINELKFDGKTTGPEAAVAVLNAERTIRKDKGADLNADAQIAVDASAADAAKEAAATAAAAAAASAKPEDDPKVLAAAIDAQVAKAKAEGRTITGSQASAELRALAKK